MKDFLKEFSQNPKAQELIRGVKEPATPEEAAVMYADIAEKAGVSVSKDTLQKLLTAKENAQQEATAKAEGAVKQALGENDLEAVAGGANPGCDDTHDPGEWCWFTDSCEYVIIYYCKMDADNYPVKPKTYTMIEEEYPFNPNNDAFNGPDLVCSFSEKM